jgi:hypothetical protein
MIKNNLKDTAILYNRLNLKTLALKCCINLTDFYFKLREDSNVTTYNLNHTEILEEIGNLTQQILEPSSENQRASIIYKQLLKYFGDVQLSQYKAYKSYC